MSELDRPEISSAALASQIRDVIARRRSATERRPAGDSAPAGPGVPARGATTPRMSIPRLRLQPDFQPSGDGSYHVSDLLKFHDGQFVRNAYRAILDREPDGAGYENHLRELRGGSINKIDVLASLRYSGEGRNKNIKVKGLALPATVRRLQRLPVFGYGIRLAIGLLRLPVLIRHHQQLEAYVLAQNQQIADHLNEVSAMLDENLRKLFATVTAETEAVTAGQRELRDDVNSRMTEAVARFEERVVEVSNTSREQFRQLLDAYETRAASASDELRSELAQLHDHIQHVRSELVLQGRRVASLLEEARGGFPASTDQPLPPNASAEERHTLDALYVALEDQFRGSREEIKRRLEVYLPHVKAATPGPGDAPVVDVGCGRGEWLELLRETGINALGVDENRVMVARCRERGLAVVEDSALNYLRGLPDGSVGALTGFHVVEHLPVEALVTLVDEAVRIVRPGGLVIFETPNPENVLVGGNYFYLDPTHLHPLPSLLMKFLLEARGLSRVEVLHLHAWDSARLRDADELTTRFNDLFYGPMDYAVIGWKS